MSEALEPLRGAVLPQPADAELRLPRPPGVFRRWLAAHPRTVDWVIVITYLFGCAVMLIAEVVSGMSAGLPWVVFQFASTALIAGALRLRRSIPLAGLLLICALSLFELGMLALPNLVALCVLLYSVPVYRSVRAGWVGFGIVALVGGTVVLLVGVGPPAVFGPGGIVSAEGPFNATERFAVGVMNVVWLLAVLMVGINVGNRKRYVEALIDRARQLAREREQRAQLAAAAERSRIAREMHDVVAHSLSVVVTLSEAASVSADTQPLAAKQAMQRAAETGRSALVEMRRLLGVLAEDGDASGESTASAGTGPGAHAPQPGVAQLSELMTGFTEAGLRIAFRERGEAQGNAAQQLAVYRIVQEGLTNALRHAGPGARVELEVQHDAAASSIELIDSGRVDRIRDEGAGVRAGIPGSGRGLAGVRQRAALFGGAVEYGPRGAGWRLWARLPVRGGAGPVGRHPEGESAQRGQGDHAPAADERRTHG